MSAWQLSSFTEFVQVNTQANPGTILLPNAAALPGRILTFKDIQGTFSQNPLTLSTIQGNAFDDGATQKILRERFGFLEIASDGISRWNVLEGTQMPMYTISSLNVVTSMSTIAASTSQLTVSTLRFNDALLPNVQSNIYTSSSLLYCAGQIVGGTRVASGPTLIGTLPRPFVPTQIPFVSLWLDGDDINTLRTTSAVTTWVDKSQTNKNATKPTNFASFDPPVVNRGVNFNNFSALLKVTNMPTAPYDIFIVGIADPTNTGYRTFLRVQGNPGNHPLIINSGTNDVGMWDSTAFRRFGTYSWAGNEQAMFYVSVAAARTQRASKNGDISLTAATAAGAVDTLITCIGNSIEPFVGQPGGIINELIIYNTTLQTDQRQLVEGYLAWKWGLVARLPAAHPYKSVPPPFFSLINTPYFLSVSGGASLIFTWSYILTAGTTNSGTNVFIYTTAVTPVLVANTTPTLSASVFSLTSDGTTNASTGFLTANLTFGTSYLARVQINIPSATFSAYSQPFVYGATALAATSPAFTATGASLSLSWTRNTTVTQPSNNTFILFYTDPAAVGVSISSTDRTTANTFTTNGTSASGNLVSNLTFNTIYYFRVGTSNILNTSSTLSVPSAGGLYGSTALAPSALGTPTGGATVSISWTRNSTNSQPSNNTKVYFYTNAAGTTFGAESIDLGTVSSFTTDGTTNPGSGNMLAFNALVFNTTYYLRVGTSNALTTGAYQNSAAVTGAVLFGAAPIAGSITSYTGGATMTATLGSTSTLSQPIASSNVLFVATDATTVVATRTGYTGGASYSSPGTSGFTSGGPLVFNTFYYLRLDLVNALGTTSFLSANTARFGDVPAVFPTGLSATASTYYGTNVVINWTAPGTGTTAQPVDYVGGGFDGASSIILFFLGPTDTTYTAGALGGPTGGNYGLPGTISLYSVNSIGENPTIATTAPIIQYEFSMGSAYNTLNSYTQTWLTTDHSQTRFNVSYGTISSGGFYVNTQILGSTTKTLSWSYTSTNMSITLTVNGTVRASSGSLANAGNGIVTRLQWSSSKGGASLVLTLTLS